MTMRCKMCGGVIEFPNGGAEGICKDCGMIHDIDRDSIYKQAEVLTETGTEESLEQAIELYRSISGWKDADKRLDGCRTQLGRMRWAKESALLKVEEDRFETKVKRWRRWGIALLIAALIIIASVTAVTLIRFKQYNKAAECYTAGEYKRAATAFQTMGDYQDAKIRVYMCAVELYKAGLYEDALPFFVWLDGYLDHGYYLRKCRERLGITDASATTPVTRPYVFLYPDETAG